MNIETKLKEQRRKEKALLKRQRREQRRQDKRNVGKSILLRSNSEQSSEAKS